MNHQSRRQFLRSSLALAGLGILPGCMIPPWQPQPPARVPRIGWLRVGGGPGGPGDAFVDGLRALGYVEGQTMTLEQRSAENHPERYPFLAAELVSLPVDVLVVVGNAAIRAALEATRTTPIVMLGSADPVGDGFVSNLARPGGNLTGLSSNAVTTIGKRLDLMREIRPSLRRLAVFWNTTEASKAREFEALRGLAQGASVELVSVGVTGLEDFEPGLASVARGRPDAMLVLEDPLMAGSQRGRITEVAHTHRLPAMGEEQEFAGAGGLAGYGRNNRDLWRRGASYVDKILKGAKPGDLPIEQPSVFDFAINLKTAEAIGLTIPPSVLAQATELIQ